jgi:CMP-N-acetylneuraminic acid synthetase
MKILNNICFILQARVNSSRLPKKMIKPFAGSSLIEIAIDKIKSSIFPNKNIYLSVNDSELIDIANNKQINIFKRSNNSTRNDDVNPFTLPEVFEWWDKLNYDYYILMNACNPLVEIDTINNFINTFSSNNQNGLFSVLEHKRFFYKKDGTIFQKFNGSDKAKVTFNTKFIEPIYSGGPLRAGKMSDIGKHIYMGEFNKPQDPPMIEYPSDQYADIDYEWEFNAVEALYKQKFK